MGADVGCKGVSPAVAVDGSWGSRTEAGWVCGAAATVGKSGQLLHRPNAARPVTQQSPSQGYTLKNRGIHTKTCPPVLTAAAFTIAQK